VTLAELVRDVPGGSLAFVGAFAGAFLRRWIDGQRDRRELAAIVREQLGAIDCPREPVLRQLLAELRARPPRVIGDGG
jgi:hypothetical protein